MQCLAEIHRHICPYNAARNGQCERPHSTERLSTWNSSDCSFGKTDVNSIQRCDSLCLFRTTVHPNLTAARTSYISCRGLDRYTHMQSSGNRMQAIGDLIVKPTIRTMLESLSRPIDRLLSVVCKLLMASKGTIHSFSKPGAAQKVMIKME